MKNLYVAHAAGMLLLFFIGFYLLSEYDKIMHLENVNLTNLAEMDYSKPSQKYGGISLFFFGFSIVLGQKTMSRLRKTGSLLFLGGIGFFCWSCLMIVSPRHISINEVFPAWIAYIIIAMVLSVIGFLKIDSVPIINTNFDDQILDD